MKKSLLAVLMLLTFAVTFTGCKKDEEDDTKKPVAENTWVIDGKVYELASSLLKPSFADNTLSAVGSEGVLSISFSKRPTSSGTFSIKSLGTDLGDNDVSVVSFSNNESTFSTGRTGDVAKVTVSNNKIRVELTNIEVEIPSDGGSKKGSLSANILEN